MPVEVDAENGNVVIDGYGRAHVFRDHAAAVEAMESDDRFPLGETYLSHHATCPQRGQWSHAPRKQQRPDPPIQESLL